MIAKLARGLLDIVRFSLFAILSALRPLIVRPCRFAAPFMLLFGVFAWGLAKNREGAIFGQLFIAGGFGAAVVAYGYNRLVLALQPKGTDIYLID